MKSVLIAYFSASGVTARLAHTLAEITKGDLHEIQPTIPYTDADLDWTNKQSRSSIEMNDKSYRPTIANKVTNMGKYDTILLGFPIWWYVAPTIINTFLEAYDLQGKTIIPFATSGSSGMGKTNEALRSSCPKADLKTGKRFAADTKKEDLANWITSLSI